MLILWKIGQKKGKFESAEDLKNEIIKIMKGAINDSNKS